MIIRLSGVTKYYGSHLALDKLSVDVRAGAIGLLGHNGAGKSTLIKLLLGLVTLNEGEASVLGFDARRQSRRIREAVGYMPEDDCHIAGLKGVEMIAYAGRLAGLPARVALRRAHEILDFAGLADERYREVQTYSTGMKQRIKLAQALIHSPKLLFLDEPTSGLDPQGRETMLRLVRSLVRDKGISVVVSTHILHDVESSCESVLILGKGRLIVYDEIENLRRSVDNSYTVRFGIADRTDRGDHLMRALEDRGLSVEVVEAGEIRVTGAPRVPDLVFEAASEVGVSVRQVAASLNSLEDIYLKAVED